MDTTMPIVGIRVERMSCKNTYTTSTTSKIASNNVFNTTLMDAFRKMFVSFRVTNSSPLGKSLPSSSSTASISLIVSEALEPAFW